MPADQHPAPAEHASTHEERIRDAALSLLDQGSTLLQSIDATTYARPVPVAFNASIGGHYRHCLNHFSSWLDGAESGVVDYDHRARDPRIETDPGAALALTRGLRDRLAALAPARLQAPASARCEVSYEHGQSPVTATSLGRELVYTVAHAIHHYALISVMAGIAGAPLPREFGLAPSTAAHRKTLAA